MTYAIIMIYINIAKSVPSLYWIKLPADLLCFSLCKIAVNETFTQNLGLDFHSFLDIYLNGSGSSVDNSRWYHINWSTWVVNMQLYFCFSIKSTHEFKWYRKTL